MTTTQQDAIEVIRDRALFVREETVRLISIAKTGHYASAFSAAEIFATLYYGVMRLRRGEPDWPERDRFLFGKGHAATALYPLLVDWDFFSKEILDEFTRLVQSGDVTALTRIPGIGKKTAERMVVELRDRVDGLDERRRIAQNLQLQSATRAHQSAADSPETAHHGLRHGRRQVARDHRRLSGTA